MSVMIEVRLDGASAEEGIREGVREYREKFGYQANLAMVNPAYGEVLAPPGIEIRQTSYARPGFVLVGER